MELEPFDSLRDMHDRLEEFVLASKNLPKHHMTHTIPTYKDSPIAPGIILAMVALPDDQVKPIATFLNEVLKHIYEPEFLKQFAELLVKFCPPPG